jgi:hypothetical protein
VRTAFTLLGSIVLVFRIIVPSTAWAADSRAGVNATIALRQLPLEIIVPNSASLGKAGAGGMINASLGTVTVTDSRSGMPIWTASVSATNFTTGSGSPAQTITRSNISYWSGPATDSTGGGSRTPGQISAANRVSLGATVTAFSGRKRAISVQSTSWRPTLVITIPQSAALGTYSGVIVHSVT